MEGESDNSLESRPAIFVIGSSNVGKRTLLSRLLGIDLEDGSDSLSDIMVHRWTINTKYYSADVFVWMADLHDDFDMHSLPISSKLNALVMVFDMSEPSTLTMLQNWVSCNDIKHIEVLLCIGNKVDLLPDHPVHAEYRRRLQKVGENSTVLNVELDEYGISETDGSGLLGSDEPSPDIRKSCLEWCVEHNIEYIEACASSVDFDKCLSVDGDSQGINRLFDALSAHMWPGMILKSGDKIKEPTLPENQELSEEESDYELEYEILSAGSAEPWDDTDEGWVSAGGFAASSDIGESIVQNVVPECEHNVGEGYAKKEQRNLTLGTSNVEKIDDAGASTATVPNELPEPDEGKHFDFEDLEHLMSEIGNIRNNLRFMPDFQRREMAANVAMKIASMFGGSSDDEE